MQGCYYITVTLLRSPFYIFQIIPPNDCRNWSVATAEFGEVSRLVYEGETGSSNCRRVANGRRILVILRLSPPCFGHFHCCKAGPWAKFTHEITSRSLSKYGVVELDRRRLNSLSSRRVDGSDFDATTSSTSRTSNSGNVSASYQINHYYVHIGVGDSNKTCKWSWLRQHLADLEKFSTGIFFTDALIIDTGRWSRQICGSPMYGLN